MKYYCTIGEVSKKINVKSHVIRYWESQIPSLKPKKILNGIRHYREDEVNRLKEVKKLIQEKGLTTEGVNNYIMKNKNQEEILNWLKKEIKEIIEIIENHE